MPSDRAAAPSGGAATDADRIAVIRALAAARQREEIVIGEQATRMDLAASAATIDELEELVADLTVRPALPTTVSPPQSGPDRPPAATSRRGLLVGAAAAVAALAGGAVVWAGTPPTRPRSPARASPCGRRPPPPCRPGCRQQRRTRRRPRPRRHRTCSARPGWAR